jgi:hypothetical protein
MAHPATKAALLAATVRDRDELIRLLSTLTPEQIAQTGAYGWSAKDHVAHLAAWERLLIDWYEAGARGEDQQLPAPGYTWATMDELNREIQARHAGEAFSQVMAEWHDSSAEMIRLVDGVPEADLLTVGRFAWTGRGTMAAYVDECGPKHYRWAAAEIKRALKAGR